jgi:hypothetical protein
MRGCPRNSLRASTKCVSSTAARPMRPSRSKDIQIGLGYGAGCGVARVGDAVSEHGRVGLVIELCPNSLGDLDATARGIPGGQALGLGCLACGPVRSRGLLNRVVKTFAFLRWSGLSP